MIDRRDIVTGLCCGLGFGLSEWMKPRNHVRLFPERRSLPSLIPSTLAGWQRGGEGDIVVPRTEGSLASRLYSEQLARLYVQADKTDDPPIMLLIAHGSAQTDSLQLHRPEACYPALGFTIVYRKFLDLKVGKATLPAVALTARTGDRIEDIIYWTRLGNDLPRDSGEQRSSRFRAALAGNIGDGVLVRASRVRISGEPARFATIQSFLISLITGIDAQARIAIIGHRPII